MTLYSLIADPEWAEILTLVTISLLCLAYASFVWGNAKQQNKRLSTGEWTMVYGLGMISFLSGILVFGKFVVPQNVDSLLETLRLDQALKYITQKFQAILISIIRPMI